MLRRLFQRNAPLPNQKPMVRGRNARVPEGTRVYAIGDIHGRSDLLMELEELIVDDAQNAPHDYTQFLVYLGDYVDRGGDSRGVIGHLHQPPPPDFERVLLLGNHDAWMREFLESRWIGASWLRFGGSATLASYGIKAVPEPDDEEQLQEMQERFASRVSDEHKQFLHGLELAFDLGDYYFCHAGVRPDLRLNQQLPKDLMWIREPFLSSEVDYGKVVVHGHTISETPVLRHNRIGIDTGAYSSEVLTCLVLEGSRQRFITTDPQAG